MKLLILGGTLFLGRHLVDVAQARGHEVTLFNRGQQNPDLFPAIETLRGDRDGNLDALAGRRWDAVIDTCGYVPRIVRASAELLAEAVDHYTFISSISVYADFSQPGINEDSPAGVLKEETVEEITGETYGPLKALCEQAAENAMPGRVLNIRPGLIVGPHDPTDRFTYWPMRVARGGEVLAPGGPAHPAQVIDVRDLAAWTVAMVEQRQIGVFNATGPDYPLTLGTALATCREVTSSDAQFTWVDELFLITNDVGAFVEMPLWTPAEFAGIEQVDVSKAIDAGARFRSLHETIRDTLAWQQSCADEPLKAGLSAERETELLALWHAQS